MKSFPAFGILLRKASERKAIENVLLAGSNLPGPRGNIELAQVFARALAGVRLEDWHWEMLSAWQSKSLAAAPVNRPEEFLPFCAALAMGVLYPSLARPGRRRALAAIEKAASDPRWRTREAVAMALQAIGEDDPAALQEIVTRWMPETDWLQKRAIAAGLAHPPLLGDAAFALFCLSVADQLMESVAGAGRGVRTHEDFRVLRQGLGYALSVYAAGLPEAGFPLLTKWAASKDPDARWIIRENLKKKRLAERHPEETAALERVFREAGEAGR
jgi:hypothetical protein